MINTVAIYIYIYTIANNNLYNDIQLTEIYCLNQDVTLSIVPDINNGCHKGNWSLRRRYHIGTPRGELFPSQTCDEFGRIGRFSGRNFA